MSRAHDWIPIIGKAAALAPAFNTPMAVGWQQNDDTGEDEPGWCPLDRVGPCFVHTPIAIVRP